MVLKTMKEKKYFTYMLRCCDNSLYSGYTTDLQKRLETHNEGKERNTQEADFPSLWYGTKNGKMNTLQEVKK